jgi:hypothetical protein
MPAWVVHPILIAIERRHWIAARIAAGFAVLGMFALVFAAGQVVPTYVAHYRLHDQATVIARTHAARSDFPGDTPELRNELMHSVRTLGLEPHLRSGDFEIASTVSRLRISCRYAVDVEILPGLRHTFHFRLHVDQVVLPKPAPIFI